MKKLENQIEVLESFVTKHELINQRISTSSVGWHIEHSLLVINSIIDTLSKSNQEDYKPAFNWRKQLVFIRKQIPRGKARAPKSVVPSGFDLERLLNHIQKTKISIKGLSHLHAGQFFKHPGLGHLTLKDTQIFIEIHTNHHLKIIKDIITK